MVFYFYLDEYKAFENFLKGGGELKGAEKMKKQMREEFSVS